MSFFMQLSPIQNETKTEFIWGKNSMISVSFIKTLSKKFYLNNSTPYITVF